MRLNTLAKALVPLIVAVSLFWSGYTSMQSKVDRNIDDAIKMKTTLSDEIRRSADIDHQMQITLRIQGVILERIEKQLDKMDKIN